MVEETGGANIPDGQVIITQFEWAKNRFDLNVYTVIANSGIDSSRVLSFIIKDLKAKPYIARKLRREKELNVSKPGNRICLAGFEILYWRKYQEGERTRIKFVYPIIHSKKFRKEKPFFPWVHPQFVKDIGRFAYTHILGKDIRQQSAGPLYAKSQCQRALCYLQSLYYCPSNFSTYCLNYCQDRKQR